VPGQSLALRKQGHAPQNEILGRSMLRLLTRRRKIIIQAGRASDI
jgi:hypothetical protein